MSDLMQTLHNSFDRSFRLYNDFVAMLEEEKLSSDLAALPSNTIGAQLWCVVGARESYAKAIQENQWSGFSCSLKTPHEKISVVKTLAESQKNVLSALETLSTFSQAQNQLVMDLLEHEVAHQGQLIRYMYALRLSIPESWKTRYSLS